MVKVRWEYDKGLVVNLPKLPASPPVKDEESTFIGSWP